MKKSTIIINTARPQLIEPRAVQDALNNGTVSSIAVDGDDDLLTPYKHKNALLTPHVADATIEAMQNITRQALIQMVQYFEGGKEVNRVA